VVEDVSLAVRAGEIVGIYGLMGAGRTEFLECLFGMQPHATGTIQLGQARIERGDIADRIRAGLALVPEDRQQLGLVQNLSVSMNITLANLRQFVRGVVLSAREENSEVERLIRLLSIKTTDARQPVTTLSGGNQQKVVLAKNLLTDPKVLLLDEPTRGIDVAAKSEIFDIMNDLADRGLGVLFVSSELKEIVAMADRAIVMARGRIVGEFEGPAINEHHLADASVKTPAPIHR
jgi:erythritol transport system ATP-binding protein